MKRTLLALTTTLAASFAYAGEDSTLSVDGEDFITQAAAPDHLEYVDTIFSGWTFRTDETQALQMDDFDNPAFVFLDQALDTWETVEGSEGKSCASCHDAIDPPGLALESFDVIGGYRGTYRKINPELADLKPNFSPKPQPVKYLDGLKVESDGETRRRR